MTHEKGTDYLSYVRAVSKNPVARRVKLADLEHNLDASRFSGCDDSLIEECDRRKSKYLEAVKILTEAENC